MAARGHGDNSPTTKKFTELDRDAADMRLDYEANA
jgi:hypothetical protein